jgi:hypothetical protein
VSHLGELLEDQLAGTLFMIGVYKAEKEADGD